MEELSSSEKRQQWNRNWYLRNKERRDELNQKYLSQPEKRAMKMARDRAYCKANPELALERVRRYRAKQRLERQKGENAFNSLVNVLVTIELPQRSSKGSKKKS